MRWRGRVARRCCSRATTLSTPTLNQPWRNRGLVPAKKILVIKLGALGDIVQAMAPAAAIREHHRGAEIVLLTTAPYAALAKQAPYFDAVWIDERPRDPIGLLRLRRRLRGGRF